MAHTVQVTKKNDGAKFLVVQVLIHGDGQSADMNGLTLLDVGDLSGTDSLTNVALEEVWYDLNGFALRLRYDGVPGQHIWSFTPNSGNHIDFCSVGGIPNTTASDGTGKVLMDSFGMSTASDMGSLMLRFRKR